MMFVNQLRGLVIYPVLNSLGIWSKSAEDLLVMIAAHESNGGQYLAQVGGPALGIYQQEPATHDDLWKRTLLDPENEHSHLVPKIMEVCNFKELPQAHMMVGNLDYATIMARIFFLRNREPIPSEIEALSQYAKHYWNTEQGKASPIDYESAYYKMEGIKP